MKNNQNVQPNKSSKKKVFLIGLVTLAAGLVSYFGFQFWKKNKEENGNSDQAPEPVKQSTVKPKPKTAPTKAKPTAAKASTKENPIPNSGNASSGSSKQQQTESGINVPLIAATIHAAILKKDFTAAFNQLKFIRSVHDYSVVSKEFLKKRTAGKPQTLVSGLLYTFKTESQRLALKKAFNAMGLKYDGKKWSLSGLDGGQLLITTQSTKVWQDPQNFVQVPINMVLGQEIAKRGEFSVFENEKRYFLVESKTVNYYKN